MLSLRVARCVSVYFVFGEECAFEVGGGLFLAAELPIISTVRDRLARQHLEGYTWRCAGGRTYQQKQSLVSDWQLLEASPSQ